MEITFYLFIVFVCGIFFNMAWGYALGLGYGLNAFQTAMINSLLLLAKNVQSVIEIQQLKYMSYEMLDRDEKYIEFQKQKCFVLIRFLYQNTTHRPELDCFHQNTLI